MTIIAILLLTAVLYVLYLSNKKKIENFESKVEEKEKAEVESATKIIDAVASDANKIISKAKSIATEDTKAVLTTAEQAISEVKKITKKS